MRYQVIKLGGLMDDYLKDRERIKNLLQPPPTSWGGTPPPASAPSAAGIEPANKICAILQAWKEEMEQKKPNIDALTEYQKAFNEVAKGMNFDAQ